MSLHIHLHTDHNHDGLLVRIARDLGAAHDWLAGPGMSEQERMQRELAQARNDRHGSGAL